LGKIFSYLSIKISIFGNFNHSVLNKKFIVNLALLLFVNILVKPFWIFGINRNVQLAVGEADYGIYYALFNFSLLLNIILDLGINNFNNRNISQHNFLLTKHFSGIVALKFLLGIVYSIITVIVALVIGYRGEQLHFLYFLIINQFLSSFVLYIRSNLAALQLFKTDSIMSVVDRLLMIIICSFLLWGNITGMQFTIEKFIYAQTCAYSLTVVAGLIILLKRMDAFKLSFNLVFSRVILKKSFPYAILILLMGFYTRIDAVMLERILPDGATHAGIYAQGFRLLDAVNMVAYLFAVLLLPIFSYMIKRKENIEELVKIAIMLLVVPAFIVSTGCFFFRYEIMSLLYNSIDNYNVTVFGILIFGFITVSTTYIFGTLLTANGSLKKLNIIASCTLIMNIILNFLLIPKFQAIGSAFVCLAVQTFPAIAQIFVAAKIFKLRVSSKNIVKAVLFIVILIVTGYFIEFYKDRLQFQWYYIFGIYGVTMLTVAIILKLFRIKGLYKIINLKKEDSL